MDIGSLSFDASTRDELISFVKGIGEIIVVTNAEGCVVALSDHSLAYLDVCKDGVVGTKIDSVFPSVYLGAVFSRTGMSETRTIVFDHTTPSGGKCKFDARCSWLTIDGEKLMVMTCRDVSSYAQDIQKLSLREELFRTIFHESPLGFIHVNSDGIMADCNQEFLSIFGLIREFVIGTNMAIEDPAFPIGATFRNAALNAIMGNGSTYEERFAVDGGFSITEGWARVSFSPIMSDTNSFLGAIGIVEDITDEKEAEEKIAYIGIHDALTGLLNRRACEDDMVKIDRPECYPIGIVYIDLNHLKLANDAFGHHEGDLLLTRCASILNGSMTANDTCYRLGGDEFVMLLKNISRSDLKSRVANINKMCQNWSGEGIVQLSMAIGAAAKNSDGQDINEVLKEAEDIMYANKLRNGPAVRKRLMTTLESKLQGLMNGAVGVRSRRMTQWGEWIAKNIPIDEDAEKRALKLLCRYHDIGLLGYTDEIQMISMPPSKRKQVPILQHTVVGYRIARTVSELNPTADFILSHHENWDGSGYPSQQQGEEIPFVSRVISIFDALEGMLCLTAGTSRPSFLEALDAIERGAGTMFDPKLVHTIADKLRRETPAFAEFQESELL